MQRGWWYYRGDGIEHSRNAGNNNVIFTKRTMMKESITNSGFNTLKFITVIKARVSLPKLQNVERTIMFEIR